MGSKSGSSWEPTKGYKGMRVGGRHCSHNLCIQNCDGRGGQPEIGMLKGQEMSRGSCKQGKCAMRMVQVCVQGPSIPLMCATLPGKCFHWLDSRQGGCQFQGAGPLPRIPRRQARAAAGLDGTALSALSSEGRGLGWARALGTSCTESAAGAKPGPGRAPGNARLLLPHATEQLRRKGRVYRGVFMACGAASH